jgi:hypothetical protein
MAVPTWVTVLCEAPNRTPSGARRNSHVLPIKLSLIRVYPGCGSPGTYDLTSLCPSMVVLVQGRAQGSRAVLMLQCCSSPALSALGHTAQVATVGKMLKL